MTSRVHLGPRPIVDSSGNLITNASVRVLQPGTTIPITDTLWQLSSGGSAQSQPWVPSDGNINFYLDRPQTVRIGITPNGGTESFFEDIDVGAVDRWRRTVKDFGAKGDGTTDDAAAIQTAINSTPANGVLYFPEGVYLVGTPITLPVVDGVTLKGASGSNARNSSVTILAKNTGTPLTGIFVSYEWLNNSTTTKDGQGLTIEGITFDGGGFAAGSTHDTQIETTSHTVYGLVIHGSNHKLINIFVNSANSDGVYIAGNKGINGTTTISETHELWWMGGGVRYVGRDGIHIAPVAQDGYIGRIKIQYAGRHAVFTDDSTAAWDFDHLHPSRCGSDFFHCLSGWEYNISHCYLDALGDFMDNVTTPHRAATDIRYGIYMTAGTDNPAHIDHNRMHTESSGGQVEPVVGLYLRGWCIATYNTLRYQASDTSVTLKDVSIPAYAFDVGNTAHSA